MYFTSLDLYKGYHQIRIAEDSREKTAFITPPFFQRVMQNVLGSILWDEALVYLDDIIIYTTEWSRHLEVVGEVLEKLKNAGLYLNVAKSWFGQKQIVYLGQVIRHGQVSPDPLKMRPLRDAPRPTTPQELRSFLGLAGYFRKFIQDYSKKMRPLYELRSGTDPLS